VAETAVRAEWPNAVGAAQPGVAAAAVVAQSDVAAAVAQSDVAAVAVAQPDAAAEQAGAPAAQDVPAERLSGPPSVVAWVFRQDRLLPSAPPRAAPTARAMAWSLSVAWPSMRWWQATLFSGVSCALGPAENSEAVVTEGELKFVKWISNGRRSTNKR
jgi:hypothetical protein